MLQVDVNKTSAASVINLLSWSTKDTANEALWPAVNDVLFLAIVATVKAPAVSNEPKLGTTVTVVPPVSGVSVGVLESTGDSDGPSPLPPPQAAKNSAANTSRLVRNKSFITDVPYLSFLNGGLYRPKIIFFLSLMQ